MRILSWNIQGLKKSQAIPKALFLIKCKKPNILFLIETMTNAENSHKLLPQLGFDHYEFICPDNHSGGLAVLWNNGNIHASVLSKDSRAIHLLIFYSSLNALSILSGVYGPANPRDKTVFWNKLTDLNTTFDLPWCIIGDLNELLSSSDKVGGLVLPTS